MAATTAVVLALSGCADPAATVSGEPRPASASGQLERRAAAATPARVRPLPVEAGWGPDRRRDRPGPHARRPGCRCASGPARSSSRRTPAPAHRPALVDRLHLGGVIPFSEQRHQRRPDHRRQPGAAAVRGTGRPWPVLVGVDQEGGRVARVTAGATGFPTFMSAGRRRRPGADPAGVRRAAAASSPRWASTSTSRPTPTSPPDRPTRRSAPAAPGRPRPRVARQVGRRHAGLRVRRPGAGRSSTSRATARSPPTATSACPCSAGRLAEPAGRRPGAVPRRHRRRRVGGDGRPPRRARGRPAACRRRCRTRWSPACCAAAGLPRRGVHRLAADGRGHGAVRQRPAPPCAR